MIIQDSSDDRVKTIKVEDVIRSNFNKYLQEYYLSTIGIDGIDERHDCAQAVTTMIREHRHLLKYPAFCSKKTRYEGVAFSKVFYLSFKYLPSFMTV